MKVFVIGGSGAYDFAKNLFGRLKESITISTPFGDVSPVYIFDLDGIEYGLISRHGEKKYSITAPFVNYRANIWAARELGAESIIAWTGPGAISECLKPGDLVIPDDVIDFTKKRSLTFFENKGIGFIRQNPVFCPTLQEMLYRYASSMRNTHKGGVYLCTEGPRLETPAEVRFFKSIGADMVGMTLIPEVFLARELELCYGAICYITNYAEGIMEFPYKKGELFEGTLPDEMKASVTETLNAIPEMIKNAVKELYTIERNCPCKDSMLRYKLRGDL